MKIKKYILILLLCCVTGVTASEKVPIVYFYESDCPDCRLINETVLPFISEKYSGKIEFIKRDVAKMKNFEAMMAFESTYSIPPQEVPGFYTSNGVTWDPKLIESELTELIKKELKKPLNGKYAQFIKKYLSSGECGISVAQILKQNYIDQPPLKICEFRKSGCSSCNRLSLSLNYLKKKYPKEIDLTTYNINSNDAKILLEAYCQKYEIEESIHLATPALFFGNNGIVSKENFKNLDIIPIIVKSIDNRGSIPTKNISESDISLAKQAIYDRYVAISWGAVLFAGLLDGINPCAFITIIFLLSYLSLMKYSRKDIALVGMSFTLSVFLTYLLIGLGLLNFVQFIQEVDYLYDAVYYSAILFALIVALLNFYDYYKIKKGSLNDMTLKLNKNLRERINAIIRKNVKVRHYVLGAFMMGFGISILELACTGQVYLPTVVFIINTQGIQFRATLLLIAYNVAFIVPLIIIFALFWHGSSEKTISQWLTNNAGKIKLSMGILFIFLALFLYLFRN